MMTGLMVERFKSIRKLELNCRRINLFIGEPNSGKGNITNQLQKLDAGTGLVDEDPGSNQPAELRNYQPVNNHNGLVLLKHKTNPDRSLVLVCPRLEECLYKRAAACGLNPCEYGLPNTPEGLHKIPGYERHSAFVDFLKQLHQLDTAMKCLKDWIKSSTS